MFPKTAHFETEDSGTLAGGKSTLLVLPRGIEASGLFNPMGSSWVGPTRSSILVIRVLFWGAISTRGQEHSQPPGGGTKLLEAGAKLPLGHY
jgi:hypothetical protein